MGDLVYGSIVGEEELVLILGLEGQTGFALAEILQEICFEH